MSTAEKLIDLSLLFEAIRKQARDVDGGMFDPGLTYQILAIEALAARGFEEACRLAENASWKT